MDDNRVSAMELEPSPGSLIQVWIVANSAIVRAGLAALLLPYPTLQVVGQAASLSAPLQSSPDVVLMEWEGADEDLTPLMGLDLDLSAVVLLLNNWQQHNSSGLLRAGIRGLLPSEATGEEIGAALESAARGLIVMHPDILEGVLPTVPTRTLTEPTSPLTLREIEVLGMLAEGVGNKTIARRLDISEHTVKFHMGSIFSKLNASSRTEAVIVGARQGLILL
jgi:two-component system, NarL family, response regulator YdfI